MRQSQREITDPALLEGILREATICRLGLQDEGFPYIVPLNFGYQDRCLYFHCAPEGKKIDCLRRNPRVGFEVESGVETQVRANPPCRSTTRFRSVIGSGRALILTETADKKQALDVILRQALGGPAPAEIGGYGDDDLARMVAIKVVIESMTGKQSKGF